MSLYTGTDRLMALRGIIRLYQHSCLHAALYATVLLTTLFRLFCGLSSGCSESACAAWYAVKHCWKACKAHGAATEGDAESVALGKGCRQAVGT